MHEPGFKVLVLGGTGFIGRNLLTNLMNYDIKLFATFYQKLPWTQNKKITWNQVDLTQAAEVKALFSSQKFDLIIQCAATTSGISDTVNRPDFHVTNNVIMNSLILREVNNFQKSHFIFLSCTNMLRSSLLPQNELSFDANLGPVFQYFGVGWTKVYIEKLCEFYSRFKNNKYTVIRHSNIYGPWDRYLPSNSHVCGATITKVLTSNDKIIIWGNGNEVRDLLYIEDLINLLFKVSKLQKSSFEIINAGGHSSISVSELTKLIINLSGKVLEIEYDLEKPTSNFSSILNSSKAEELFDWKAETPLEQGLKTTISFWKNNYNLNYSE